MYDKIYRRGDKENCEKLFISKQKSAFKTAKFRHQIDRLEVENLFSVIQTHSTRGSNTSLRFESYSCIEVDK